MYRYASNWWNFGWYNVYGMFLGGALADGTTIKRRYFSATDGMTMEQIQEMTYEEERMESVWGCLQ